MRRTSRITYFFDPRVGTKCEPKRNKGSGDVALMEMFDFSYNLLIALTEKEKQ
jgi:hypothetical protein